ncbi:MAG: glycosyltransferase [Clostridium sp.]|jgi:glycosyltransferase involved in cell wall biosynthesis|nr:glycosyltransferase [Clostridium sp.]
MKTFSLAMIVRNEEQILARCLDRLAPIADEIVIVDTGSIDATKQIAEGYTEKIVDFSWQNNFAEARNFMMSQTSGDYVLLADADEQFSYSIVNELAAYKHRLTSENAVITMYDDPLNGFVSKRIRLLRRNANFVWIHPIHERVDLMDPVITIDALVVHTRTHASTSPRRFSIIRKMINEAYPFDLELALNCWLDAYRLHDTLLTKELWHICTICAKQTKDKSIALFFAKILQKASDFPAALDLLTLADCGDTVLARLLRLQSSCGRKQT